MAENNDRNFDFADYLVEIQRSQRRTTGISGNAVAIYQYLGIGDTATFTDGGLVITQATTGTYGTGQYNLCVFGA